jgi:hypothetical protein
MKINWHQNPLRTTIDLDEQDKERLLFAVQNEEYSQILCSLNLWLNGRIEKDVPHTIEEVQKRISGWGEICNMDVTHEDVQVLVEDLQHSHGGDCTCFPMSCSKCRAEDYLGVSTIRGLGKHQANKIMGAFGKDGDRTIVEAIKILEVKPEYKKSDTWPDSVGYDIHIPRWESERLSAVEWLKKYKEEHNF